MHHFCHFLWIDFRQLSTNTYPGGVSRHVVSHSRKVSIKGSNFPKTLFLWYPICDQPTGHGKRSATPTLFPSHSGHPTDVPFLGAFAEGCTVFHLSTSESVLISDTWMGTQSRHLARGGTLLNRPIINMNKHHSPGGATIGYVRIGLPICSGIVIHCTYSS